MVMIKFAVPYNEDDYGDTDVLHSLNYQNYEKTLRAKAASMQGCKW